MSGKSKASERTNLGTGAAPINLVQSCQQPFYENYPTLDSRDTGPFTRQDGFQKRHKVYSVVYGNTKIEFLILPLLFRQSSSNQIQNIL